MGASHLNDRYAWLSFSQPDIRVFPACSCFFLHKSWLMPVVVLAGLALRASEQMRPWAVCWALESSLRDMRRTKSPCWRYTCGICKARVSKSCDLWSWCYQKWVCIKHIFISGYKIMCPSLVFTCWLLWLSTFTVRVYHSCLRASISAFPRLKIYQGVYFSTPKCCSTLIIGKTLH